MFLYRQGIRFNTDTPNPQLFFMPSAYGKSTKIQLLYTPRSDIALKLAHCAPRICATLDLSCFGCRAVLMQN
jgi:hypothetical protein